jgi:hypothetical protein
MNKIRIEFQQMCSSVFYNKIKSPHAGFQVLTAVVMNVAIFWNILPCSPYMTLCFRGLYHVHLQGKKIS